MNKQINTTLPEINIGIDTSQSHLDIFFTVPNDDVGIKQAIKQIKPLKPGRVLIEAIGRLEMNFVCQAHKTKLPIVVCNTGQIRQFAKATGRIAKTDKLDAQDVAYFGEALKPDITPLKSQKLRQISDL